MKGLSGRLAAIICKRKFRLGIASRTSSWLHKAFRWIENEFQFEDYEKYKAEEKTSFEISDYPYEVTAFFEQVGVLTEKRFVDLDVIDDRLGRDIISNWKKLEPWMMALRREKGDETFGEHFQKLYEKTIRYMKKRWKHISPANLIISKETELLGISLWQPTAITAKGRFHTGEILHLVFSLFLWARASGYE